MHIGDFAVMFTFGVFAGTVSAFLLMRACIEDSAKRKTIFHMGNRRYWVAPADPTITFPENPFQEGGKTCRNLSN